MLTASEELEQFLRGLDDDSFRSFCHERLHINFNAFQDVPLATISFERKRWFRGIDVADLDDARNRIVEIILTFKHTDMPFFDLACREAGIQTDDARKLDLQRVTSEAEAEAAQSAKVSATAATASEKHAETSNRIAVKANRLSCWSLVVALGALAVAIWALFAGE